MRNYKEEYISIRPNYERFRIKLSDLLNELIKESQIDIVSIDSRTKTIESFEEKTNRPSKKYDNPLDEITDLCGVRIVTYYTEDIYKIASLLEGEFKIDPNNSVDKIQANSPDKFGYQSLHYVLSLDKKRSNLIEWKAFKKFKSEIQIQSILQHSWAAIDHKLRYKTKGEIPTILKRKIYRLSALLELADEEFLTIKNETLRLHSEIENSIDQGNLEIEFNIISITSYLDGNKKVHDIEKLALDLGFLEESNEDYDDEYEIFFYTRLIAALKISNLKSIKDLDIFLNISSYSIKEKLKLFIDYFKSLEQGNFYTVKSDLIIILLVLSRELNIDINNSSFRKTVGWEAMLDTFDSLIK